MSEAISKYAQFVDLLLSKTKQGKIPWGFDAGRNVVSVWNGDVLLNVVKEQDEFYEDTFKVHLFNKSGTFLEGFNEETLSEVGVREGEDPYFVRLRDLYNLAMKQATGADKALDDFIDAVRSDKLDVDF